MTPARLWWKQWYHLRRIARREALKATLDMMAYGTGAVLVDANGEPHHICVSDIPREILKP